VLRKGDLRISGTVAQIPCSSTIIARSMPPRITRVPFRTGSHVGIAPVAHEP
jgi:hypothetical protein